jgi:hypothetical protein
MTRHSCAVGSAVYPYSCKLLSSNDTSHENGAWIIDRGTGTFACQESNGTKLCATVASTATRNVTMEICSSLPGSTVY